jgi:uncharacterized protein YneF (UPF0154 family)
MIDVLAIAATGVFIGVFIGSKKFREFLGF